MVMEVYPKNLEHIARSIYDETDRHYHRKKNEVHSARLGFRILYGPPVFDARYLFLGFQPGGQTDESNEGQHDHWPPASWYLNADTRKDILARKLRRVFNLNSINHMGLNAVFFRAPSLKQWSRTADRADMETFSIARAKEIVNAAAPRHLIVVGFTTLDLLKVGAPYKTVICKKSGGRLAAVGELWGRQAYCIAHLSGARIGNADIEKLRTFFRDLT